MKDVCGMVQCQCGMSHCCLVDLCCDSHPFAAILKGPGTGLEKYKQMAAILDGDLASRQEVTRFLGLGFRV